MKSRHCRVLCIVIAAGMLACVASPLVAQTESTTQIHRPVVTAIAMSPDGSTLAAAGDDHKVRIWNAATGKTIHLLGAHKDWLRAVAFSPDGTMLATGGDDGLVKFWDVATGKIVGQLPKRKQAIFTIAFSPDGSMLASAGYGA
ncbi:MAG: hypothetical protein MI757_07875, partial [Pirellulales bacterium]|nr:hypothetical protein [Pirellulales bacterium]